MDRNIEKQDLVKHDEIEISSDVVPQPSSDVTEIDRGRAWIIAAACCWITFLTYGYLAGIGVVFDSFIDTFHFNRRDASWPISVLTASQRLSTPIIAVLCNYISLRLITFLGALATIAALGSCHFVQTLIPLTLLFGLVQGIGYALLTIPAVLIVNLYFVRYRTIANGIQLGGASLGGIVFLPLMDLIVRKIGVQNLFLCMATLLLTSICGPLLFRRPKYGPKDSLEQQNPVSEREHVSSDASTQLPEQLHNVLTVDETKTLPEGIHTNGSISENGLVQNGHCSRTQSNLNDAPRQGVDNNCELPNQKDEDYSSILPKENCGTTVVSINGDMPASLGETKCEDMEKEGSKWKVFLYIIRHPVFWLIEMEGILTGTGFMVQNEVFMDYATEWHINTRTGSYFLSFLFVMDLSGRLSAGWITDFGFLSRQRLLQTLCFLIGCILTLMTMFASTYSFVILNVYCGVVSGMKVPLVHALQAEYFGAENLSLTVAIDEFINGLLMLTTPFIIGYFRDTVGSYNGVQLSLAVLFVLEGLLWFLEPIIMKRREKQLLKTKERSESYGSIDANDKNSTRTGA